MVVLTVTNGISTALFASLIAAEILGQAATSDVFSLRICKEYVKHLAVVYIIIVCPMLCMDRI